MSDETRAEEIAAKERVEAARSDAADVVEANRSDAADRVELDRSDAADRVELDRSDAEEVIEADRVKAGDRVEAAREEAARIIIETARIQADSLVIESVVGPRLSNMQFKLNLVALFALLGLIVVSFLLTRQVSQIQSELDNWCHESQVRTVAINEALPLGARLCWKFRPVDMSMSGEHANELSKARAKKSSRRWVVLGIFLVASMLLFAFSIQKQQADLREAVHEACMQRRINAQRAVALYDGQITIERDNKVQIKPIVDRRIALWEAAKPIVPDC